MEIKLKILFSKLNQREKILLAVIVWTILITMISSALESTGEISSKWSVASETIKLQEDTLNKATRIKQEFTQRWDNMKPEKTFSPTQLAGKVDTIVRLHDLTGKTNASTPRSKQEGLMNVHTILVNIKKADIQKLMDFDKTIKKETPYMALQKVNITLSTTPPLLNAEIRIRAFERREDAGI